MAADSARSDRRKRESAEGVRLTAEALEHLPPRVWDVFHDVHWPGSRFGRIDHIVVGPSGVFVIDTKNWPGEVSVRRGVLRQNGRRRDAAVVEATEAAFSVAQLLPDISPTHVTGVLCFAGDHHVTGWVRGTMLCSTRNIATLLAARPPVLMTAIREDVAHRLRRQVARPAPALPQAVLRRSRVRQTFIASLVGGVVAAGTLVVVTHPDLPDKVGDLVVGIVGDDSGQGHGRPHGQR